MVLVCFIRDCFFFFKRGRGGMVLLKESTVFTVIVCFTTVFTTVFNGFHSFRLFHNSFHDGFQVFSQFSYVL